MVSAAEDHDRGLPFSNILDKRASGCHGTGMDGGRCTMGKKKGVGTKNTSLNCISRYNFLRTYGTVRKFASLLLLSLSPLVRFILSFCAGGCYF